MRIKHSIAKTALSMGLSALMVVGGIPAQAMAEVADGQESLTSQEELKPTEEMPAKEPADVAIQVQDQGSAEATEGEGATEQIEVRTQGDASPEEVAGQPKTIALDSNAVAASGLWGTCPWKLYGDGRLVIDPGTGANTVDNKSPWADYAELITSVTVGTKTGGRVIGPANCSYLFCDMSKMKSFDGSGFDCSNVTSIKGIFKNCMQLSDISGMSMWNTARVQNMDSAFDDCMRIQTLDLSGWDTRSVTSSGEIFPFCRPKTFAIGEKYRMSMWADEITVRQTIPYAPAPPDSWLDYSSSWWSTRDGKYYGVNEIMSNRMGIADVYTSEQPSAGWARVSSTWYYYDEDGESHKGWLKSGDKWYYLDPATGAMKTGLQSVGGKWYLLASSGHMLTGWQKVGSAWYYFNGSGAMQTGWIKLGSTWYYLKASGAMATGWCKVGSTWYYFNGSGAMQTGWIKLGNTWYYLKASGAMVTGWLQLGSTWHYFNGSGAMLMGRQNIGGKWYTFSSSGAWVG